MEEYIRKTKIKVKKEDYKFGIIRDIRVHDPQTNYGRFITVGVCNCGQHMMGGNGQSGFTCENCRNQFFVDATRQNNHRFTIPYLGLHHKDSRGFKIKRTNLSVIYTGEEVIPVQENLTRTMEYDMVKGILTVYRNEEAEFDLRFQSDAGRDIQNVNTKFFTNLPESLFWNFISTDVTRDIYVVAKNLSHNHGLKNAPMKGLARLAKPEHRWIQILANAGIPNVVRFYKGRYYYSYNSDAIDTEKTKPHEILRVPKFMMQYIREDVTITKDTLSKFRGHLERINNNLLREMMDIVKDEGSIADLSNSIEDIVTVHVDYGYNNLKKLILYLFREVNLTQGIENASSAVTYLKDYIRMSKALNLEWEKYPKSLKKVHDVVLLNYKMITNDEKSKKLFKLAVEKNSYQKLSFAEKKEKFAVITPKTPEDLVKEGNQLSHCISSYTKAVIEDKCKLLFLRNVDDIETPLVSIEVRGFNIRQAKGKANRPVTNEEKEFIKKWAQEKELIEAYY